MKEIIDIILSDSFVRMVQSIILFDLVIRVYRLEKRK